MKNKPKKPDEIRFVSDKKTDPILFISERPTKLHKPQNRLTTISGTPIVEDLDKVGVL